MAESIVEPEIEGEFTIKIDDFGTSYTMSGRTYTTATKSSMLISNFSMPKQMAEHVMKMALGSMQSNLADKIARSVASEVERLYGKQARALAKDWIKNHEDEIVHKLVDDAKANFMDSLESYED